MNDPPQIPRTCLPDWDIEDLPTPRPLSWRNWSRFIGPGIVMMGIQIGGGEWLLGPEVTAKYGGGLMWIATIAIILQVFYNIECGRYALYCGEPVFTGFLRTRPGPRFWMAFFYLLNFSALIPGLSTHGAALAASLILNRPPGVEDRALVIFLAYLFLFVVALPVLIGGKVYNVLQWIMTIKVSVVLGFCLIIGLTWVSRDNWWNVFSGFVKFGNVPIVSEGRDATINLFTNWWDSGSLPVIALSNIAVLGAFAGYAGGGGLGNATYGNFVRDQGWGMGSVVGAIPSAVGGRHVTLSHIGKVFPISRENLVKWNGWWRYILVDQIAVWAPGCFMGMALPALLSMQFSPYSKLGTGAKLEWAQSLITADGVRHAPEFSPQSAELLWILTVVVGMLVMLPSQMSIVDDFSRRWTDILWSGSRRIRTNFHGHDVKYVYYSILGTYVAWTILATFLFSTYGTPKLMTLVIANLNNLAIGLTSFHLIWINSRFLPKEIRPRWYHRAGVLGCGIFYLGIAVLVFVTKQIPILQEMLVGDGT